VGAIMSIVTEYYTSVGRKPVNTIIQQSSTGHATNIISGLAVGMQSTVIPIIVLASGIYISFEFAGLYGVAIAAAGMMATTAMQLAIDGFGPIADNAGGIAEMSGLPDEVRERTDNLDAVGNTTAAAGKGFAIASAALTALALFAAFVGVAGIDSIDIYKADVLAGLFVGGMIPFIFSALTIAAVGRAAMEMVNEVRRQFREIPGIMEYKATPEYEKCIEISTKASIREMMLPGAIALVVPVLVGFIFGPEVLGGLLAGVTVTGVLMGIFQNNADDAWDNAKKSIEQGVMVDGEMHYKGSEIHKASVTGDTVGDPFKDTSGPSMNILIKLMSIVSLVIAPHISEGVSNVDTSSNANQQTIEAFADEATTETVSSVLQDGEYLISSNQHYVLWEARKVGGSHEGRVPISSGKLVVKNNQITSGEVVVDMTNILVDDIEDTDKNGKLVNHLKSDDFFNTNEFPEAVIKFNATQGESGEEQLLVGEMTIKGVTEVVRFDASFRQSVASTIAAKAYIKVNRTKHGITYKSVSVDKLLDKFIYDDFDLTVKFNAESKI